MDSVVEFKDNDEKYFKWLSQHPSAYVINTRRVIDAEYMVLHKSTCFHISTYSKRASSGAFTENLYINICSSSMKSLSLWAENNGRKDGSFSKECSLCHPLIYKSITVSAR
ncbi:MAG: hypothetical protein COB14_08925 [Alphaproteobacteria bacterium]|nr:MAG: hypothetical protein COB14_08925 [Alphaproteobacteria bacterium]